jgi:hypothetical protein
VSELVLPTAVVVEIDVSFVEFVDELAHASAPAITTKRSGMSMTWRRFRIRQHFHVQVRNA